MHCPYVANRCEEPGVATYQKLLCDIGSSVQRAAARLVLMASAVDPAWIQSAPALVDHGGLPKGIKGLGNLGAHLGHLRNHQREPWEPKQQLMARDGIEDLN